ncbi:TLD-domain-containing protein, partial [Chytridium lagenaria]
GFLSTFYRNLAQLQDNSIEDGCLFYKVQPESEFSEQELNALRSSFHNFQVLDTSKAPFLLILKDYLTHAFSTHPVPDITFPLWCRGAFVLLKGSWSEKESFGKFCSSKQTPRAFLTHLSTYILPSSGTQGTTGQASDRLIDFLLLPWPRPIVDPFFDDQKPSEKIRALDNISEWFPTNPWLCQLWDVAFEKLFYGSQGSSIGKTVPPGKEHAKPALHRIPQLQRPSTAQYPLLHIEDIFVLDAALPLDSRTSMWRQLFSTMSDGKSWSTMVGKIEDTGSVLVIVRDKEGAVFGAFASQELTTSPKFKGTSDGFTFTLQPKIEVFKSAGINEHYQYFNYGTSTLPNGIGFGGQLDYFGLWIDSDFGKGHSRGNPSSTFSNPPLSSKEDFLIDDLECYLIKAKEVDDRLVPEKKRGNKSVLDDATQTAFLEMAGKVFVSKDVERAQKNEEE